MSGAARCIRWCPGHEIVGRVTAVGKDVTKFKPKATSPAWVSWSTPAASADNCKAEDEAYCEKGFVGTYNARGYDGVPAHGGYSNNIVCDARYVHTIDEDGSNRSWPRWLRCCARASRPTVR